MSSLLTESLYETFTEPLYYWLSDFFDFYSGFREKYPELYDVVLSENKEDQVNSPGLLNKVFGMLEDPDLENLNSESDFYSRSSNFQRQMYHGEHQHFKEFIDFFFRLVSSGTNFDTYSKMHPIAWGSLVCGMHRFHYHDSEIWKMFIMDANKFKTKRDVNEWFIANDEKISTLLNETKGKGKGRGKGRGKDRDPSQDGEETPQKETKIIDLDLLHSKTNNARQNGKDTPAVGIAPSKTDYSKAPTSKSANEYRKSVENDITRKSEEVYESQDGPHKVQRNDEVLLATLQLHPNSKPFHPQYTTPSNLDLRNPGQHLTGSVDQYGSNHYYQIFANSGDQAATGHTGNQRNTAKAGQEMGSNMDVQTDPSVRSETVSGDITEPADCVTNGQAAVHAHYNTGNLADFNGAVNRVPSQTTARVKQPPMENGHTSMPSNASQGAAPHFTSQPNPNSSDQSDTAEPVENQPTDNITDSSPQETENDKTQKKSGTPNSGGRNGRKNRGKRKNRS